MTWKKLFFSLKGRIGRHDWWIGFAVFFVLGLAYAALEVWLTSDVDPEVKDPSRLTTWRYLAYSLLTLWPSLAIYTKRLHDLGRGIWWNLLFFLPNFSYVAFDVLGLVATPPQNGLFFLFFIISFYSSTLISLLWLGAIRGQKGENAFGADPVPPALYNADQMSWQQVLFGSKGRLSRARLWKGLGLVLLVQLALFILYCMIFISELYWLGIPLTELAKEGAMPGLLKGLIEKSVWAYFALAVATLLYNLCTLLIKRLHDRGRKGWGLLLPLLPGLALVEIWALAGQFSLPSFTTPVLWGLLGIALVWLLTESLFLRGTHGANKYGPDPLTLLTPPSGETN